MIHIESLELPEPIDLKKIDLRGYDFPEALRRAKILIADIISRLPYRGFDISYIREKTPKEEIEDVTKLIASSCDELRGRASAILEKINMYENIYSIRIMDESSVLSQLEVEILKLASDVNSLIFEIRRLADIFIKYTTIKAFENMGRPAGT